MKRIAVNLFLTVLIGLLAVIVHAEQIPTTGTIYIRSDGSIDPPTAPIQQTGSIYTLTSNINGSLVVEKNNTVVDGAGYILRGIGSEKGVYLNGRRNITIKDMKIESFNYGIELTNSTDNTVTENDITANNYSGIFLHESSNNSIFVNSVVDNLNGIYVWGSSNNKIYKNNITANSQTGILFSWSSNNSISVNSIVDNLNGIYLQRSSNNTIFGNNITTNYWDGILLSSSSDNTLAENVFTDCGLAALSSYENSVEDNYVNGKPLSYLEGVSDHTIVDAGQVVLVSCNNIRVENLHLSETSTGVQLWNTTGTVIKNNTLAKNHKYGINLDGSSNNNRILRNNVTNNDIGVSIQNSFNNTLLENSITKNKFKGFLIYSSFSNVIHGNNITANSNCGIYLWGSPSNKIYRNNVTANDQTGIWLDESPNNSIYQNSITENFESGVSLSSSSNNSITGNIFLEDGLQIWDSYGNVVQENLVNGKSLVYLEDAGGVRVEEAGQVILVNCNNITVKNLSLSHTSMGVQLWRTTNTQIAENNMTTNNHGVHIYESPNNVITRNNIKNNTFGIYLWNSCNNSIARNHVANNDYGIHLFVSSDNVVHHNNLVDNDRQAYSDGRNFWDDGFEGNYWSDYNDTDSNLDGLGDTAYVIGSGDEDDYPLTGRYHSFNTSLGCAVAIISNSAIRRFAYFQPNTTLRMYVSNTTAGQTCGFCRVAIPHILLNVTNISVIVDGGSASILYRNDTIYDNGTHRWIYFAYPHSAQQIDIIPEYPSILILPFMIAAVLTVTIFKRKRIKSQKIRAV